MLCYVGKHQGLAGGSHESMIPPLKNRPELGGPVHPLIFSMIPHSPHPAKPPKVAHRGPSPHLSIRPPEIRAQGAVAGSALAGGR